MITDRRRLEAVLRSDFRAFVRKSFATLSPGQTFTPAWHIEAIAHRLESVRTGGVASAARDDPGGRFGAGDALGYVGEELVAWGEPESTLAAAIKGVSEGMEVITCIAGDGAPLDREAVEPLVPDGVELDHHVGGQPAWWWLLCAQ